MGALEGVPGGFSDEELAAGCSSLPAPAPRRAPLWGLPLGLALLWRRRLRARL